MKKPLYIYIIVLGILLSSCSSFLGTGLHHQSFSYMAKPLCVNDSTKTSRWYASVATGRGHAGVWAKNAGDKNGWGQLAIHRAISAPKGSIAYGTFGYYGQYIVSENSFVPDTVSLSPYRGRYNYYGGGLRFSANLATSNRWIIWRYLGVEATYYTENGSLNGLRNTLINQRNPRWYVAPNREVFNWGVSSELIFTTKTGATASTKLIMGGSNDNVLLANTVFSHNSISSNIELPMGNIFFQTINLSYWQLGFSYHLGKDK